MPFDHKAFIAQLTQRPGVYQMFDAKGQLLYVGKAKNLKKRVSSYFRKSGLSTKTAALVSRIESIQITVTQTEVEALILEQNLIKQGKPPFNILLRDDKSYPYIFLSDKDNFPRLSLHRGVKRRKGSYFGPFPSVQAVRESLSFLQKTFKVRQCEDSFFKNRSRACLQYQINRCTGPCVGLIEKDEYADDVRHTKMFLDGKSDALIAELVPAMEKASNDLNFERAALLRDQISALRSIQSEQVIESGSGNVDVIACATQDNYAGIHVLYIRQGRIVGSRSFYLKSPLGSSPADVMSEFIPQYYMATKGARTPGELLVSEPLEQLKVLSQALSENAAKKVQIKHSVRGNRQQWLDLASRTALQNLQGYLASQQNNLQRFEALRDALDLDETPQRLECFDISHSSGEATVASCVVFNTSGPLTSDYRRFNISNNVVAGDDYGAMAEALQRRYKRLSEGEAPLPDVLFVDGGKGQLNKAVEILAELNVLGVTIVGVAKGSTRKAGFETLLLNVNDAEKPREVELNTDASALLLIQHIRDESHRFAITGHRQRRDKKRKTSQLEGIAGIGPKRRKELLRFFGGVKEIEGASVAELMRVPNISRKVAETVYSALHNE